MPVLEITDESGTWFLSQSIAIAHFLAKRFGNNGVDLEYIIYNHPFKYRFDR